MYISGNFNDFEPRLHQLAVTSQDITSFAVEGNGYYSQMITSGLNYFIDHWNKEFVKKQYSLVNIISADGLEYDAGGDLILDV